MADLTTQPLEMRMGHLAKKLGGKLIYGGITAEADRDTVLHCNLGVVDLIQSGLGKHWVQFSLASDLLIAFQLD